MKGAKTSGKSVTMSIVNIGAEMFAFLRRFAWFGSGGTNGAPDAYQALRLQAFRAIERGEFERAEELLSHLLASKSEKLGQLERATLHNKRGVARISRGSRDTAREDFDTAVTVMGNFAPALTNLGNMLLEEERVEEAIAYYERALQADDAYAGAYRNLGIAYKRQGRTGEAVRAFRRADRPKRRGRFF
jgi:tetratricopeptide (TPR) repeat protein